jgi:hypothetical protein
MVVDDVVVGVCHPENCWCLPYPHILSWTTLQGKKKSDVAQYVVSMMAIASEPYLKI